MKIMIRLLLIEDDASLAYILKCGLEDAIEGYEVFVAKNGNEGVSMAAQLQPDIIVSDIEMPEMTGFEMFEKMKELGLQIPLIFASGKTDSKWAVAGLSAGADNYIKKPYTPQELDAHIKAVLSRIYHKNNEVADKMSKIGEYKFLVYKHTLIFKDFVTKLSGYETSILKILDDNRNEPVKRKNIMLQIWGNEDKYISRRLDVFISKLRHLLQNDSSIEIRNIRSESLILIC